jgi:acyl-coenzyme A thioesterase PaaI-like protein
MKTERIEMPKPQGHNCFACGTENPIGLDLKFYRLGETICTDITLGKNYVGWQNIAHGGIITTVLDEVMSWTILYLKKVFIVTRKMEVKFIKPVLVEVPLTVRGRLDGKQRPPLVGATAEMLDQENKVLARSSGQFVEISSEEFSAVPEKEKKEILTLFTQIPEP